MKLIVSLSSVKVYPFNPLGRLESFFTSPALALKGLIYITLSMPVRLVVSALTMFAKPIQNIKIEIIFFIIYLFLLR
jgi:hypothetical protein